MLNTGSSPNTGLRKWPSNVVLPVLRCPTLTITITKQSPATTDSCSPSAIQRTMGIKHHFRLYGAVGKNLLRQLGGCNSGGGSDFEKAGFIDRQPRPTALNQPPQPGLVPPQITCPVPKELIPVDFLLASNFAKPANALTRHDSGSRILAQLASVEATHC
jgi:hypothetical protein